jgi:FkbM family methyltransferase
MESAFSNWRWPGYVGSLAYRIQPISSRAFDVLMNSKVSLHTRDGTSLLARLRDVNGPAEVFGGGEYAHAWLDWKAIEYVLDFGAHVGAFAIWATGQSHCRVACFEPNPEVRAILRSNVARLNLTDRISVHQLALAAGRGRRRLSRPQDSAASTLTDSESTDDVEVDTIGLDEAIRMSGFPRIDLLKVDIEGAEFEVFGGSVRPLSSVEFAVVECHPRIDSSFATVATALRAAGLEVAAVTKPQGLELLIARRRTPAVV